MLSLGLGLITTRPAPSAPPDLVTNGGFDADSDWTKGTGWAISGGRASHTGTTGGGLAQSVGGLTVGVSYRATATLDTTGDTFLSNTAFQVRSSADSATVAAVASSGNVGGIAANTAGQALSLTFTAATTSHVIRVFSEDTVSVDNITLTLA